MNVFSKLFLAFAFSVSAFIPTAHAVQVAFLEVRAPDGRLIVLEPGGRFAHVAISYEKGWLHAHPATGVTWSPTLARFGSVVAVLTDGNDLDPSREVVSSYLGKPYDQRFSWSDDALYCSELVAKLAGIPPTPMDFAGERWRDSTSGLPKGELGISPDEVYRWLKERAGWREI
jgi:hypothetical protein